MLVWFWPLLIEPPPPPATVLGVSEPAPPLTNAVPGWFAVPYQLG